MNTLVSDTTIAGGGDDFLTARHLVLRGRQHDIGRELAQIAVGDLGTNKQIPWSNPATTSAQLRWLREHWPAHHARSCGVAEALELAPDDHTIDPTTLYYYWAVPGCSNVFWPPASTANGHAVLTRNYDFMTGTVFELMGRPIPPDTRNTTAAPFVIETHPEAGEGYATLSLSSYDLLGATDGINSEGLAVALMATNDLLLSETHNPATRKTGVGINEIQLVRFLLENAASVSEAHEVLAQTPQYTMWVPCHYIIADRYGDCFVYSRDVSPDAPIIRHGDGRRPLCATNHIPGHIVESSAEIENSMERLASLQASIESMVAEPAAEAADMLAVAHSVAATDPPGQGQYQSPSRTLWHAVYDLEARALDIDFYLGDSASGDIRRSDQTTIRL